MLERKKKKKEGNGGGGISIGGQFFDDFGQIFLSLYFSSFSLVWKFFLKLLVQSSFNLYIRGINVARPPANIRGLYTGSVLTLTEFRPGPKGFVDLLLLLFHMVILSSIFLLFFFRYYFCISFLIPEQFPFFRLSWKQMFLFLRIYINFNDFFFII